MCVRAWVPGRGNDLEVADVEQTGHVSDGDWRSATVYATTVWAFDILSGQKKACIGQSTASEWEEHTIFF